MLFGEFTDDQAAPAAAAEKMVVTDTVDECMADTVEERMADTVEERMADTVEERMALHLAVHPDVVLKSQQRGEPDLTTQEKMDIALDLAKKSPSQFLYRFGRFLQLDHLCYFDKAASEDTVAAHYLAETRQKLDSKKAKVIVRNRRWAAVQRSSSTSTSDDDHYFTETAMKQRNPLLYQHLVGQHLTEQEKQEQKQDFDKADCRITTMIFEHLDRCDEGVLKSEQEDREDDMFEEEEEEDDNDDAMEDDSKDAVIDETHKGLLKKEFVSSMYNTFIMGKDETFNYKDIDENDQYDLLDIENNDKEEIYFDEEEPCEASATSSRSSPILPEMCLDRRLLSGNSQIASKNSSISDKSPVNIPEQQSVEDLLQVESLSIV